MWSKCMCELVKLSNSKINSFKLMNNSRKEFNLLNKDFFERDEENRDHGYHPARW